MVIPFVVAIPGILAFNLFSSDLHNDALAAAGVVVLTGILYPVFWQEISSGEN